jgi:2-polyprenyl-3-methyl-5-hydroxy-6-metoxy-1,4-benzoquinol methylase
MGLWHRQRPSQVQRRGVNVPFTTMSTKLKRRQSVMWGNGPYERVMDTIADVHALVVERLEPQPGRRWLDLACGTGAVAERAATAGRPRAVSLGCSR